MNVEEEDFREKMFQDIVPETDIENSSPPSTANTPPTPKVLDMPISTPPARTPVKPPQASATTPENISARPKRSRQMPTHFKDFVMK